MIEKNLKELILLITRRCFSDQWGFLTATYSHINVGSGKDVTIKELAGSIASCVGFTGAIDFDESKPDGAPRKFLDSSKLLKMGWMPVSNLTQGLSIAYRDFCENLHL